MKGKSRCERCGRGFSDHEPAYTCERGCAWCGPCARGYGLKCPNCAGALEIRRNTSGSRPPPPRAPERLLVAATPGVPDGGDEGAA